MGNCLLAKDTSEYTSHFVLWLASCSVLLLLLWHSDGDVQTAGWGSGHLSFVYLHMEKLICQIARCGCLGMKLSFLYLYFLNSFMASTEVWRHLELNFWCDILNLYITFTMSPPTSCFAAVWYHFYSALSPLIIPC